MSQKVEAGSILFECQRCTACCRIPGFIKLLPDEVDRIAGYLGMTIQNFTNNFCDILPSRTGLTLTSHSDHSCIFLDGNECRIHAVKPAQCQGFPNSWNFPGWRKMCKAIPIKK